MWTNAMLSFLQLPYRAIVVLFSIDTNPLGGPQSKGCHSGHYTRQTAQIHQTSAGLPYIRPQIPPRGEPLKEKQQLKVLNGNLALGYSTRKSTKDGGGH